MCVEQPDASDEELLADIIQEKKKFKTVNQQNLDFIRKIFNNIDSCLEEIDSKIQMYAPSFPLDKISKVDMNILRLGTYEILYGDCQEVPAVVAINEAIELAKTFGNESSPKFVNAVLNAIMNKEKSCQNDNP
ncbi:transcription antitermination factor NusB [Candidatus Peregrinibacteria bacterium RIFOXYA12_FULL_33_12]|nr:MAG: transcription antitermination factor NusB [Candidatus Peregrinibacteria bacterium RIFOXYA12_FULL_33_12]OGJ45160.1 MAG: transcription antitermination factor NusB [Candidatus Peregrinibacteria bacterium RIFOXYA2_FULL_33_21]OGJ50829.1 MAG: transcription antitermination factor NusB [Candidatus Peregrinibacteria bacterium RIFOXYB2_FULL_33_20]